MKAVRKVPRPRRGRKAKPHGRENTPAAADLRSFVLEIEPAIHRLGDGIEALQAAGNAADAIAASAIAWFADTLRVDFDALHRVIERTDAQTGLRRRGRRPS